MSSCLKLWLWNRSGSWGWTAGQMESVAEGSSHRSFGSRRCLQVPCACWLLVFQWSNLWSWFFIWWCRRLLVPCLMFWAFQSVIFNICVSTQGCKLEGRVISQYNQSLCVNITSKEVKGWVAEAEPSSWLVSAAAPLGCLLAVHGLFLLGHEPPPWLGKFFFWWSPNQS